MNQRMQNSSQSLIIKSQQFHSIAQIQCEHPQTIIELQVIHCHLETLQGIEQYINIEKLNLKYNQIKDPAELQYIYDCGRIIELNIQGNDIQHYATCKYISLKQNGFDSLVILNGRDYSSWRDKKMRRKKNTKNDMKKICSKADSMYRDMKKTLKNSLRANILQEYRVQNNENYDQNTSYSQTHSNLTTQRVTSSCRKKYVPQQYLSEDKNPKQISLQNANFMRSVSCQGYSSRKPQMEDCLPKNSEYYTINKIQLEPQQVPNVLQPTATFASQRMKQTAPFRSRNNQKSIINIYLEDQPKTESCQEQNFITQSCQEHNNRSFDSYDQQSFSQKPTYSRSNRNIELLRNSHISTKGHDEVEQYLATHFYIKNLFQKVVKSLKFCSSVNMPLRSKQNCF